MPEVTEQAAPINFKPPGKYAVVIGYDNTNFGRFAVAVACKRVDNSTFAIDSGASSPATAGELLAYQTALQAQGFTVQRTLYASNILAQAQAAALVLAATL